MGRPWRSEESVLGKFSPCGTYRYWLVVQWHALFPELYQPGKTMAIVALNPSKADLQRDDATLRKCVNWGRSHGFGQLLMLNAYPFRSTDPKVMLAADDPFGEQSPEDLVKLCDGASVVVAAWGNHAQHRGRGAHIAEAFDKAGIQLKCWATNRDGSPGHPLYLSLGDVKPWRCGGFL